MNADQSRKNAAWACGALNLTTQTECPLPTGNAGFWNDSGTVKYRDEDGNDSNMPIGTVAYAPVDLVSASNIAGTYSSTTKRLTVTATGDLTVDGVVATAGMRLLLQTQTTASQQGIYIVTTAGALGVSPVLTRADDLDVSSAFVNGAIVPVETGGTTYGGTLWQLGFSGAFTMDTTTPAFSQTVASVTWAAIVSAATTANTTLSLKKETNQTINVATSTSSNTAGANLSILSAAGVGSGVGGTLALTGGAGGATGAGGPAAVTGGAGGATSGAGGAVSMIGGVGTNGNSAGGAAALAGGVGQGSAAGGAASVAGGVGGATGAGGAASLVGGAAGGAAAAGGAIAITGGLGNTTGAGGAIVAAGGAGGNDAVGGLVSLTGGAAGGGNRAGGAASLVGGAGAGTQAGGAAAVTGGAGGATGAGGAITVTGGAGGATSGTGGAVTVAGGAGTNGNANGGALALNGGAKNGSGTDGAVSIAAVGASLAIGNSGAIATWASKQAAGAATNTIADPGNAGAIPVTADGVCMLTSAGAETRTLAIPTYVGQRIALMTTVYVGDIVITVAARINQANNTIITMGAVADFIELLGVTIAGNLRWQVVANDGAALS